MNIKFSGDTKIRTLEGVFKLKDLVGKKDVYIYSVKDDLKFIPTKLIKIEKCNEPSKLIEIEFNDNSSVICSDDIKFLYNNNWVNYKEIENEYIATLKTRSYNKRKYENVEQVYIPKSKRVRFGKWDMTHLHIRSALRLPQNKFSYRSIIPIDILEDLILVNSRESEVDLETYTIEVENSNNTIVLSNGVIVKAKI